MMANNRLFLVCNKCYPTDEDLWENGGKPWYPDYPDIVHIGKWYPVGSYRTGQDEVLGKAINEYLDKHAHDEDVDSAAGMIQNENPVRLVYEIYARDFPAIKKWEPKND